jgi:hypothetical protein
MSDPTIFVCKPKSIAASDKAKLSKAGIIIIEMDDPSQFKLIRASTEIDSSAMLGFALQAIKDGKSGETRDKLAWNIINAYLTSGAEP